MAAPRSLSAPQQLDISNATRGGSETVQKGDGVSEKGNEQDVPRQGDFKPLNTGWIDEHVACVREWVANIFFYRRGSTTIMIDAGYNYDRLAEKMGWLGIDPASIRHILITHQDTDNVGAVESDTPGLFRGATLYVGETENRYLTGDTIWLGADGATTSSPRWRRITSWRCGRFRARAHPRLRRPILRLRI